MGQLFYTLWVNLFFYQGETMSNELSSDEVAILVRARQISKEKGLAYDADVKTICEQAGISRKTGYQWTKKYCNQSNDSDSVLIEELDQAKKKYSLLEKNYDDLRFENEGRKLAMEIHGFNEFLASQKKSTMKYQKRKKP